MHRVGMRTQSIRKSDCGSDAARKACLKTNASTTPRQTRTPGEWNRFEVLNLPCARPPPRVGASQFTTEYKLRAGPIKPFPARRNCTSSDKDLDNGRRSPARPFSVALCVIFVSLWLLLLKGNHRDTKITQRATEVWEDAGFLHVGRDRRTIGGDGQSDQPMAVTPINEIGISGRLSEAWQWRGIPRSAQAYRNHRRSNSAVRRTFSQRTNCALYENGGRLESLASGKVRPTTSADLHFLKVDRDEAAPTTILERAWVRLKGRREYEREQIAAAPAPVPEDYGMKEWDEDRCWW